MSASAVSSTVWYGLAVLAVIMTFVIADAPVARRRVEAFAVRQHLTVTEDNCRQVIAYLAVTRRWRAAGVAAALTWYLVGALRHHSIGIHLTYALSGWFLGALIAEGRLSTVVTSRRAASLHRRTPGGYLPPLNRRMLATAATACLALTGIAAASGSVAGGRTIAVWVAAGMGLPALVAVVTRKILLRPQPQASADVVSADDAIRRRSLRVVSASAITLLLYCVADQLLVLLARAEAGTAVAVVLILASAVTVPVTGWRLAGGKVKA